MLHIIVPPREGGVMDFSRQLQAELGQDSRLLALAPETIQEALDADDILLQFSGYGFAKRGAPLGLLRALQKRRPKLHRLGIFFHELYAFAPPWRSAFWLSPAQRWISRELAGLCDYWLTSRELSAEWLGRTAGAKPHAVLPIFSSMGEAATYSKGRAPKAIVFGSPGLRARTYQHAGAALLPWLRAEGLTLHDIGDPLPDPRISEQLQRAGALMHGRLEPPAVGSLLTDARYGLLSYPLDYAAKSSVLGAYAAHGLAPLLLWDCFSNHDGLVPGETYFAGIPARPFDTAEALRVGESAWRWYQPHRLATHVAAIRHLSGLPTGPLPC